MHRVDWDARLQEVLAFCQQNGHLPGSWKWGYVYSADENQVKDVRRFSLGGTAEGSRERQLALWLKTTFERSPDHPLLKQISTYPTREENQARAVFQRILEFCQRHGQRVDRSDWGEYEDEPPLQPFEGEQDILELWESADTLHNAELEALREQVFNFPTRFELRYREELGSVRAFCEKYGRRPHFHSLYSSERDILRMLEGIRYFFKSDEERAGSGDPHFTPEFRQTIREFDAWYKNVPEQTPCDTHLMIEARKAEGLLPDNKPTKTSCGLYGRNHGSAAPKVKRIEPSASG